MELYHRIILIATITCIITSQNVLAQMPPALNIPPTNAFDHVYSDNGTIKSLNFSMPLNFKGGAGVKVQSNNATHTVIVSTVVSPNTQGTYNTTQANNININTQGYKINFINGTGCTVNVLNSKSSTQVNVTIACNGSGGTVTGSGLANQMTYWTSGSVIAGATNMIWDNVNSVFKGLSDKTTSLGTSSLRFLNGFFSVMNATTIIDNATKTHDILPVIGTHINVDTDTNFTKNSLYNMSNISIGVPKQTDGFDLFCGPGTVAKSCTMAWVGYNLQPAILFERSSANYPSNGQSVAGQNLGQIVARGNTGSAFSMNMARILFMPAETTTATNEGSDIVIQTTPLGSTTEANTLSIFSLTSNFTSNLAYLAGNFTSDAQAISNMPIKNHYCATYFVTGNSTFRHICNFNGVAHPIGKG